VDRAEVRGLPCLAVAATGSPARGRYSPQSAEGHARAREKPAGAAQIPLVGQQHINNLPILVDRPIQLSTARSLSPTAHPQINDLLRHADTPADIDQQRGEPLDHR